MSGRGRWAEWIAAAGAAALLSSCAGKPPPPPVAAAQPPAPVAAPPPPPVAAADEDWRDMPLTPGEWRYSDGRADYAGFSLSCDAAARRIAIARAGATGEVRVRTTYGVRTVPPGAAAAAGDPLLDEIAFSRGRFAVESEGQPMLLIPAWPEPARVIEDCRG